MLDDYVRLSAHHLQTPSSKLFLRKVIDAFHSKSGHLPIGCQHSTCLKGPLLKCLKSRDGLRQRNIPCGASRISCLWAPQNLTGKSRVCCTQSVPDGILYSVYSRPRRLAGVVEGHVEDKSSRFWDLFPSKAGCVCSLGDWVGHLT